MTCTGRASVMVLIRTRVAILADEPSRKGCDPVCPARGGMAFRELPRALRRMPMPDRIDAQRAQRFDELPDAVDRHAVTVDAVLDQVARRTHGFWRNEGPPGRCSLVQHYAPLLGAGRQDERIGGRIPADDRSAIETADEAHVRRCGRTQRCPLRPVADDHDVGVEARSGLQQDVGALLGVEPAHVEDSEAGEA